MKYKLDEGEIRQACIEYAVRRLCLTMKDRKGSAEIIRERTGHSHGGQRIRTSVEVEIVEVDRQ